MAMDEGWSWVVCAGTFLMNALTMGFAQAIGVYYVEFLSVFNESKGTTAWISSLNFGTLCAIGPVASLIIHRWSYRVTMFTGGLISATGLFICAFAGNIYVVLICLGFLMGCGAGLAFTAGVVVISAYFDRLRPLALGLAMNGSSLGNIFFPWITTSLIQCFGWRGALLITSGLALNMCVCAMLMIKPSTTASRVTMVTTPDSGQQGKSINGDIHEKMNEGINATEIAEWKNATEIAEGRKIVTEITEDSIKVITKQILMKVNFALFLLCTVLFLFGCAVIFTHVPAFAESRGVSRSFGNLLVSAIGFSLVIGRVLLGSLCQHRRVNALILHMAAIFVCGLSMMGLALWSSPVSMMICACVFGVSAAAFGPTMAEVTFLMTGAKGFNFAYGFVLVANALGWLIGAPAGGLVYDSTQHYPDSFYMGGGVTLLGSLVLLPTAIRDRTTHHQI